MSSQYHAPVLPEESVAHLLKNESGIYVDCTLGGGGHTERFLDALGTSGRVIGIDADADAIAYATERLKRFDNFDARQVFYDQLDVVLYELMQIPVDGVFFDLGISSYQIDEASRGFTFRVDGPLDMRFDQRQRLTAEDILNDYSQDELARIIRSYGEERHWRAIARDIVAVRQVEAFTRSSQLVDVVRRITGERFLNKSLARVFQALRIEVNRELERLEKALQQAFDSLKQDGRLVVISYHSLEDRIVKRFLQEKQRDCICPQEFPVCRCDKEKEVKILERGVVASEAEVAENPRSRSARMRVAKKLTAYKELDY
ncbi:MAG: 16S rRNA (cytosine(1402)-N(4))-methyltransferase RsmH [Calditrichia bacterium]